MKVRVLEDLCFSGYAVGDAVVRMLGVGADGCMTLLRLCFPPADCVPAPGLILRKGGCPAAPQCDPGPFSSQHAVFST